MLHILAAAKQHAAAQLHHAAPAPRCANQRHPHARRSRFNDERDAWSSHPNGEGKRGAGEGGFEWKRAVSRLCWARVLIFMTQCACLCDVRGCESRLDLKLPPPPTHHHHHHHPKSALPKIAKPSGSRSSSSARMIVTLLFRSKCACRASNCATVRYASAARAFVMVWCELISHLIAAMQFVHVCVCMSVAALTATA